MFIEKMLLAFRFVVCSCTVMSSRCLAFISTCALMIMKSKCCKAVCYAIMTICWLYNIVIICLCSLKALKILFWFEQAVPLPVELPSLSCSTENLEAWWVLLSSSKK
jgi:hypothetical protein